VSNYNRTLDTRERCTVLRETARTTTRWRHKSATGAKLRTCVLPELSAGSRHHGHVSLQVELLDPRNEVACSHYREWARLNLSWSNPRRDLEIEIHATILALCLERKANSRLRPDIRFSAFFAAHQLDISEQLVVLTPADDPGRSRAAGLDDPIYGSYVREFDAGWAQASRLRLSPVRWSPLDTRGTLSVDHVRNLFKELDLPGRAFTDEELRSIVERLDIDDDQGDDPRRGVDSA
jgi:hypothetical protein